MKATYLKYFAFLGGRKIVPIRPLPSIVPNVVFSLRINPRPSDFINEPNLKTFRQTLMDDNDASLVLVVTTPAIVAPLSPIIQGGVRRSTSIVGTSALVTLAYINETTKLSILMNKTIPMVLAPVRTALALRGSSPPS